MTYSQPWDLDLALFPHFIYSILKKQMLPKC